MDRCWCIFCRQRDCSHGSLLAEDLSFGLLFKAVILQLGFGGVCIRCRSGGSGVGNRQFGFKCGVSLFKPPYTSLELLERLEDSVVCCWFLVAVANCLSACSLCFFGYVGASNCSEEFRHFRCERIVDFFECYAKLVKCLSIGCDCVAMGLGCTVDIT